MPAIGLAAAILERRDPEAVLGLFAADHVITEPDNFRAAVAEAVALARLGELVTTGIEPTHAATGFGYIRLGEPLGVADAPNAYRVDEFVEKPDEATAAAYLETGAYRWNAGMFVVGATTLLELLAHTHLDMVDYLPTIAADSRRMRDLWPTLPKIAIDHAVAEPAAAAGRVAVVPAALGWDDVGDFASLTRLCPRRPSCRASRPSGRPTTSSRSTRRRPSRPAVVSSHSSGSRTSSSSTPRTRSSSPARTAQQGREEDRRDPDRARAHRPHLSAQRQRTQPHIPGPARTSGCQPHRVPGVRLNSARAEPPSALFPRARGTEGTGWS